MNTKILWLGVALAFCSGSEARACGASPELLAKMAVSTNAAAASNAIAQLRALGGEGLNALLKEHDLMQPRFNKDDPQWVRLRAALDAVSGQRDCHASRLFWHKDFDAAKADAQRTGKPILSLRLLGNLDEELSCANSRFFRTTLYANKEVSGYLRDHFVLHWKSVRPVPRITIDMGDGRKIERTITGNSIHYMLNANGEVVDALPGLYGPRAFLTGLKAAEAMVANTAKLEPYTRGRLLENYHSTALGGINQRWAKDLAIVNTPGAAAQIKILNGSPFAQANPPATAAMPLARTKSGIETPMLRTVVPRRAELERTTDDALWAKIAGLHQEDAKLDSGSVTLILAKTLNAQEAMRRTESKRIVEDPMFRMVQNLQRSIAEDTVRNEYTFHAKIHEWLAVAGASREVEAINRRVYAELFLTPDSDPWLGLAPADTFSALENGGFGQSTGLQTRSAR